MLLLAVYKDINNGTWYFAAHFKDYKGNTLYRKRRNFKKKKEAQIAERELIESLKNPTDILTFKQLSEKYMTYSIGRKKERSIFNQNNLINKVLIPYFGNMNVDDITPNDIDSFYKSILPNYSNATMSNIRTRLSAIINYGVNFFGVKRNVVKIVDLPKKDEVKKLKYWTLEQLIEFLSVVDNTIYKTMFSVLFWTGLRKGEMLALRLCDIDFKNHTLNIEYSWNGKKVTSVKNTPSNRRIGIPVHVCEQLSELVLEQEKKFGTIKPTDYLFTVRNPEEPMTPSNVNLQLKKYTDKTSLPKIRVHYFRHSHASLLINNGVSLYVVSRHLGHDDIQTTANTYGHLYPNSEKEVSEMLNNAFINAIEN